MKILIVGFGSIGRRHFRNLISLGVDDILFYRSRMSTLSTDELNGYIVETELEAALAHQPDAVIISNPTALHLDVAIPAARAGCHLFIEKPISHNLKGIDELTNALAFGGGAVYIGYQFRHHPGLKLAKAKLDAGEIGTPIFMRAHWGEYLPNWHPWEDYRRSYSARAELGGGVILTLSHPIDYMRWMFGEVSEVCALTTDSNSLELDVEDVAEIGLRFASGSIGSIHLNYLQQPASHNLEIVGTLGTIQWDNANGETHIIVPGKTETEWKIYEPPKGFERNHLFVAQMEHFLEVVSGSASSQCTLQDGIGALKIALAAHESQQQGTTIKP
jgi:predicted dehydrogenase